MSPSARFAVAVTCMDGRIQAAVAEAVRHEHGVEHVDMVTVPGVDGALLEAGSAARQQVLDAVRISVAAHGSAVALVAGHTECAGHPVEEQQHAADVASAVAWLQGELADLRVVGGVVDTASGTVRPV